jgi:hypothetical protein
LPSSEKSSVILAVAVYSAIIEQHQEGGVNSSEFFDLGVSLVKELFSSFPGLRNQGNIIIERQLSKPISPDVEMSLFTESN